MDWVAHGFEIVQSIFPQCNSPLPILSQRTAYTRTADRPRHAIGGDVTEWQKAIASFEIDLLCNDNVIDHGRSENVLGGPVSALQHLVGLLARDMINPPLAAGEIVTTGTLTRAMPVKSGETWSTALKRIRLAGIRLKFD